MRWNPVLYSDSDSCGSSLGTSQRQLTFHSQQSVDLRGCRLASKLHGFNIYKSGALTARNAPSPYPTMAAATMQGTLQGDMTLLFPDHALIQVLMFWLEVTYLPSFCFPQPQHSRCSFHCNWALVFPPAMVAVLQRQKKWFPNMQSTEGCSWLRHKISLLLVCSAV